jgi:hypothetical protein
LMRAASCRLSARLLLPAVLSSGGGGEISLIMLLLDYRHSHLSLMVF